MKPSILLTALLFLTLLAVAQSKKDTIAPKINLSDLPKTNIRLFPPETSDSTFYIFSHFEVIDERPDTARVGIRTNKTNRGLFPGRDRQLVFGQPTANEIAAYLNQHFARPGAPYTALVILRGLWLSNAIYIPRTEIRDRDKEFGKGHIHLKAEVYASKDSLYTPVFRYDTLFIEKTNKYYASLNTSYPQLEKDLSDLLINMADSASWVTRDKQGKSRQITRQQINDFNQTRFFLPFDNKTTYTRGVYMSFEEFRNNAPSILDFEIRTEEKYNQVLYIRDASGTLYYSHTAWGYCDGKSIFIMRDGILRPAWKEGSAFYFYTYSESEKLEEYESYNPGTPTITSPSGAVVRGTAPSLTPVTQSVKEKERTIYTIDMDTGKAY